MLRSLGFTFKAIGDTSDFFIENTRVDVCFLGVEIFIEGSTHDTVIINTDAILLQEKVDVRVVS